MSSHTPGKWVVPVANVFRILAIDENNVATKLIHDQPEMDSWFGQDRLRWEEDDGPEVAANTRLMASAPRMLEDHAFFLSRQGLSQDEVAAKLVERYHVTPGSALAAAAKGACQ